MERLTAPPNTRERAIIGAAGRDLCDELTILRSAEDWSDIAPALDRIEVMARYLVMYGKRPVRASLIGLIESDPR